MTPRRAAALLGVAENASVDEIRDGYMKRVRQLHPDSGGASQAGARADFARLVAARDFLLDRRHSAPKAVVAAGSSGYGRLFDQSEPARPTHHWVA